MIRNLKTKKEEANSSKAMLKKLLILLTEKGIITSEDVEQIKGNKLEVNFL